MTKKPVSDIFQRYLNELKRSVAKGDYTEMTLRTPLENFIKGLNPDFDVTHEAKRLKALGAPDFTAYRSGVNVGYIEAKDLKKNLDEELESKQIKKYRQSIDNIVLTNYRRFILIRGNQTIFDQSLFSDANLHDQKSRVKENKIDEFLQLIDTFFGYSQPTITSAKVLAEELAKKTKLLKDLVTEQLEEDLWAIEQGINPSPLYDFCKTLHELIKDIAIEDVADAYAQTIAYGLFLARYYHNGPLERDTAYRFIPNRITLIRHIFSHITGDYLPANVSWIVDELINILNASDIEAILTQISETGKGMKDPFYIFYEDFLALYEPEKRKHRGVYYTPTPVVNFIVRSVHQILKSDFDKHNGLSDDNVTVLDPAVGTGAFLSSACVTVLDDLRKRGLKGLIPKKIENHLLRNFYGFEILVTSYVIAHLKLTLLLNYYYRFGEDDRLQVYLTNTLDPFETHGQIPFFRDLTEESIAADDIKLRKHILVILGNPPYRGMSANKGRWIDDLLKNKYTRSDGEIDYGYYSVSGQPLGEKNPKWLQDDYVKFLRFAQRKIDTSGEGVVAFITNNSYLDNPTFRGMRQSLLGSFQRIFILNLHGNIRIKEQCPDGTRDENVFDIQPGVAIALFIKTNKLSDRKVFYADLWGVKDYKYDWLLNNTVETVDWIEIIPKEPDNFFTPQDYSLEEEYRTFWKLTDIFQEYNAAIVTARDKLTIKWTPEEIWETVINFSKIDPEHAREVYNLNNSAREVALAQKDLTNSGLSKEKITPILYRPFDVRYTYYTGNSQGFHNRPRGDLMPHMIQDNIGLIAQRAMVANHPCNYFFISSYMISNGVIRSDNRSIESLFPLYLYDSTSDKRRQPNFTTQFTDFIEKHYGNKITPEAVLGYIYAVLYSPSFRKKYCELLRRNFPRVPFIESNDTFERLSKLGRELIDIHTMKSQLAPETRFDEPGSNVVDFVKYQNNRILINEVQYFDGIPMNIWSFSIGAYQVLDKWLKSRKGRELSSGEIEHFLQVVEVIKKTIECMKEIDGLAPFSQV